MIDRNKYPTFHDYFKIESPERFYIIGFTMADGSIADNKNRYGNKVLRYRLAQKDLCILKYIRKELSPTRPISCNLIKRFNKIYKEAYFEIYSKNICDDLEKYNIIPAKTGKEKLPFIPEIYKKHYLRGLFDGDGSIIIENRYKKYGVLTITSGSYEFLEQVNKKLMFNYGKIKQKSKNCYYIVINKTLHILHLSDYMYGDGGFCLKRKRIIFNKLKRLNYAIAA